MIISDHQYALLKPKKKSTKDIAKVNQGQPVTISTGHHFMVGSTNSIFASLPIVTPQFSQKQLIMANLTSW
jgi:hypothetical protein